MHSCIENALARAFRMGLSCDNPDEMAGKFCEGLNDPVANSVDGVEDIRGLMTLAREMGKDCVGTTDAYDMGRNMAALVKETSVNQDEWIVRYLRLKAIESRIETRLHYRAKRLCEEAGLDDSLLGIHPHNASVARNTGNPWPNVDYAKVDQCLEALSHQYDYSRYMSQWDHEIRAISDKLEPR